MRKHALTFLPLPLLLHPTQSALQTPCQIPLKNHPIYFHKSFWQSKGKSYLNSILYTKWLFHKFTLKLVTTFSNWNTYRGLHQLLLPTRKDTLPLEMPQGCLVYLHMSRQQKNLPRLLFLNQIPTLKVEIPQYYHLSSSITSHWWRLSYLHHLH